MNLTPKQFIVTGRQVAPRNQLIGDICELLQEKDCRKIAIRLGKIPTPVIKDWYDNARGWKVNPGALFNKWVKEYKQSLK